MFSVPRYQSDVRVTNRLFAALLWLTELTAEDRLLAYQNNISTKRRYIASKIGAPAPTAIHAGITALMGKRTQCHLFTSENFDHEPTHCISLRKDDSGLWSPSTGRCHPAGKRSKAGVLLDVARSTLEAVERVPKLIRISPGGKDTLAEMYDILADYEMRRMVSHCFIVGRLVGALYRTCDRIALEHSKTPGLVIIRVDTSLGGWTTPFTLEAVGGRSRGQRRVKPTATFVLDANARLSTQGFEFARYIMPCISESHIIEELQAPNRSTSVRLSNMCATLLLAGLLPFVIVTHEYREVEKHDVVVPHYDVDTELVILTVVARRQNAPGNAPRVIVSEDGVLSPNKHLLTALRSYFMDEPEGAYGHTHRVRSVFTTLDRFGVPNTEQGILAYFDALDSPLTNAQHVFVKQVFASLPVPQ